MSIPSINWKTTISMTIPMFFVSVLQLYYTQIYFYSSWFENETCELEAWILYAAVKICLDFMHTVHR
jgi:hypothetical protein